MFRNPRENRALPRSAQLEPSIGRPPSPPHSLSTSTVTNMAAKSIPKKTTPKSNSTSTLPKTTQTTLVPSAWGKKATAGNSKTKPKATANGNIKAFFKKAEQLNNQIFLQEKGASAAVAVSEDGEDEVWTDQVEDVADIDNAEQRYNENNGSFKKRKISEDEPPPTIKVPVSETEHEAAVGAPVSILEQSSRNNKKTGPFLDDSDSESDEELSIPKRGTLSRNQTKAIASSEIPLESSHTDREPPIEPIPPVLKSEEISYIEEDNIDDFEGLEDDSLLEGEEYDERRWMAEQRRLEMTELGLEGDPDDFDPPDLFPDNDINGNKQQSTNAPSCPLCAATLTGLSEREVSIHVNACLDGNSIPVSDTKTTVRETTPPKHTLFKPQPRPPKPGQDNPIKFGDSVPPSKSAFSKLMANHAEDAAWATAAAQQTAARGKPAYQRTCPFYKIMPGFYICVDAFRYGAVEGQQAYFLSHFHSDHYIGLTASWSHGPIYCSKVTGNLVRQQLRVDPKWVIDLEFEENTEIPNTQGVHVTMIPANHCPGSSLFLFEKEVSKGSFPKLQRVLHCGDFRACREHIEHPLLKPEMLDSISGTSRYQKLDICYLDTTYLNPKYAFPPQQQVIQACADMCVSLSKEIVDVTDDYEKMKRQRAGVGMTKFVQTTSKANAVEHSDKDQEAEATKKRGRLLVIVGTYSIGKERICIGIAKALNSKIYAPPNKQRICRALEDAELDALLTKDPREAQVHMTPLFEIRPDTLDDYLSGYSDRFTRVVGFRPSGWNYRPPKSRFTESPSVQTVLYSDNWKSQFSMRDLTAQRGSTQRAKCFGVPYSEHSSFRELTMFCCALRIEKIIPTVNVGSAKSRETMKAWCERWAVEKRKNGLFRLGEDGSGW
ncbi:DRMBL-domain-containing protein [Periconia macrospinosa]|uniref:DRMBL-domain-containing protein n=1 Tax=Periconia macrospinosa TaxID=97972 RepID=A0A2V1E272_9PLEO|nr:DRMBL-domain-containing protein [Periconia macrospinosa]